MPIITIKIKWLLYYIMECTFFKSEVQNDSYILYIYIYKNNELWAAFHYPK